MRTYEELALEARRLEAIVIDQQTQLSRLQRRLDTLREEHRMRGEKITRLTRQVEKLERRLRGRPGEDQAVHRFEQDDYEGRQP